MTEQRPEPETMTRAELCKELNAEGYAVDQLWNFKEPTLRLMVEDLREAE